MEPSVKARGGLSTTLCIWGKIRGGASTISCRGFLSIKSGRLKWRKSFFGLYASRAKGGCKYASTRRARRWGFAKKRILYKKHRSAAKVRSMLLLTFYHRLTRAHTPASASFRRFLPFSPWLAVSPPASQKPKITRKFIAGRCGKRETLRGRRCDTVGGQNPLEEPPPPKPPPPPEKPPPPPEKPPEKPPP